MKKQPLIIGFIILILFISFSGCFGNPMKTTTMSIPEIKAASINISYDELMRNNSNYVGKIVYFRGQIVQVIEGGSDFYSFRVSTKNQGYGMYYDNEIYLNYKGSRLLEKDIIDIWGYVKGLMTYTTVLGAQVTLPELDAFHTELVKKAGSP